MAEKDKIEKILEDYTDVFADICNTLVFKKPYLKEELLQSGETESIYKAEQGELANQFRDKIMHYGNQTYTLTSIGIENQSAPEKYMPVRVMGYDFASYRNQLDKQRRLSPVLTIVLNFGNKRWRKPRNLHSLMDIPKELKSYVQDYRILVFDIAFLEDEVIERFTSDFKVVARFFKQKRLHPNGEFLKDDTVIKHVEAVMELFRVFTGDSSYTEIYRDILKEREQKGEKISMNNVEKYYTNKGRREGLHEGRREGRREGQCSAIFSLVQDGHITLQVAAANLKMPAEEITKRMEESGYQVPVLCG